MIWVRQESDFFLPMIKDNKNGMNHRRNCSVFKQNLGKIYNRAFWVWKWNSSSVSPSKRLSLIHGLWAKVTCRTVVSKHGLRLAITKLWLRELLLKPQKNLRPYMVELPKFSEPSPQICCWRRGPLRISGHLLLECFNQLMTSKDLNGIFP